MAAQIETTKSVAYVVTGSDSDEASVTKVVMYMILVPGQLAEGERGQGHVHTQLITRS
jgi:hypothetical protein